MFSLSSSPILLLFSSPPRSGDGLWLISKIHWKSVESGKKDKVGKKAPSSLWNHFSFNKLFRIHQKWFLSSFPGGLCLAYSLWILKKYAANRFTFTDNPCRKHRLSLSEKNAFWTFVINLINYHICSDLVNKSTRSLTYFRARNESSFVCVFLWNSEAVCKAVT